MLEKILKMYVLAMQNDVRSPTPHLFGPPGTGKSTMVQEAADLLGVQMHTINVSRISPLELEGVQMPNSSNTKLNLLTATFWTQLKEGDILLFDEFLRGFPEVYNGLLDIFTSRRVGAYVLPKVFIIAASNSVVAYDKALEDRLLHIPVPDIRRNSTERKLQVKRFLADAGMLGSIATSMEVKELVENEIAPMYELLDQLKKTSRTVVGSNTTEGSSFRNLLGQIQLREIHSSCLQSVVEANNRSAKTNKYYQNMVLWDKSNDSDFSDFETAIPAIEAAIEKGKLSKAEQQNHRSNLQIYSRWKGDKEYEEKQQHELNKTLREVDEDGIFIS